MVTPFWAIAKKYLGNGSRYKEIVSLNGLKSNVIYSGMKLKDSEQVNRTYHTPSADFSVEGVIFFAHFTLTKVCFFSGYSEKRYFSGTRYHYDRHGTLTNCGTPTPGLRL